MFEGKTIVVTGSRGFIGSYLVQQLLRQKAHVRGIDLPEGIDLTDWSQIETLPPFDALVHLAAKTFVPDSYQNPRNFYSTNLVTTLHALELCRIHQAKMIFASSYVYGHPITLPISEDHPTDPNNPYAAGKLIGEQLCKSYHQHFGIKVVVLRPFNVYGPKQDPRFLIPSIFEQLESGYIGLKDPRPKRDFIFIDDVVQAYVTALVYNDSSYEVFNIGQGKSYSVQEVVETIVEISGTQAQVEFTQEQRPHEILDTVADVSKAERLLGWKPTWTFREGLKRCFEERTKVNTP